MRNKEIEQLKDTRKQKGITIVELAAQLGISQGYIARIESGDQPATQEEVDRIRDILR